MTSKEALISLECELRQLQKGKITAKQADELHIIGEDLELLEYYDKWYSTHFLGGLKL